MNIGISDVHVQLYISWPLLLQAPTVVSPIIDNVYLTDVYGSTKRNTDCHLTRGVARSLCRGWTSCSCFWSSSSAHDTETDGAFTHSWLCVSDWTPRVASMHTPWLSRVCLSVFLSEVSSHNKLLIPKTSDLGDRHFVIRSLYKNLYWCDFTY